MSSSGPSYSSQLSSMNKTLVDQISDLQTREQSLYRTLQGTTDAPTQQKLIEAINALAQLRLNLYKTAGLNNNVLNATETQMNEQKKMIDRHKFRNANKLRMVEVNTYYGKQYAAHSSVMQVVVICTLILVALAVLFNFSLLPRNLYILLCVIVIVVAVFIVGGKIVDIQSRDNMNWDEYDWNFVPPSGVSTTPSVSPKLVQASSSASASAGGSCANNICCAEGTNWNPEIARCVVCGGTTKWDPQSNQCKQ